MVTVSVCSSQKSVVVWLRVEEVAGQGCPTVVGISLEDDVTVVVVDSGGQAN